MGLFGIALGLVVLAAAAVFGLQQYDTITTDQRASETQMLLVQVAAKMQSAYRSQTTYGTTGTVLTGTAVGLNIVPRDYHTGAATAESPFKEPMVITAEVNEFEIEVSDLDEGECEALLTRPWRRGELRTIEIGTSTAESPDTITPADVETGCTGASTDVVFRFR